MGQQREVRDDMSQEEQSEQLADTYNGPTLFDEEAVLEAEFGPADADGVYGAPSPSPEGSDH